MKYKNKEKKRSSNINIAVEKERMKRIKQFAEFFFLFSKHNVPKDYQSAVTTKVKLISVKKKYTFPLLFN